MLANNHVFVAWEEHMICQEKGNRLVHYYVKDCTGDLVLAVVGTERSIRHMIYVVSEEFLQIYGSSPYVNASTKWRARREVVEWLTSLVPEHCSPSTISNFGVNRLTQLLGPRDLSMAGVTHPYTNLPDRMIPVPRNLKVMNSEIVWSGDAWICCKQLKHYPSFCWNGTSIAVHSFVLIMAEEENHYVGYLEDLYEDKKGQKKVKVRWFHHSQEVKSVIPQLDPHPREILCTPHVQSISAECIYGPTTVLTPNHFEKWSITVPQTYPSAIYMCYRQFRNNKVKPFAISKLSGYANQAIVSTMEGCLVSKQKFKAHKSDGEGEEKLCCEESGTKGAKRTRSCREHQRHGGGHSATLSVHRSQPSKCELTYKKLRIRLSTNGPIDIKLIGHEVLHQTSFQIDEKIELLCQDSGVRGCWFRCKILQASHKHLKVHYNDILDADGSGNLEEWVSASRVASPDKLGMRCSGRPTIRPWPPEGTSDCPFELGAAVDAWWSNGWWEGVVTEVNQYGSEDFRVYFPGEDMFLILERNYLRTSRDWVDNRWVDIKAKSDTIPYISTFSTNMKLPMRSPMAIAGAADSGGFRSVDCRLSTASKFDITAEEEKQELPSLATSDGPGIADDLNFKKQLRIRDKDEVDKNHYGVEGNKAKSVSKDCFEPANHKNETTKSIEVVP